MVDPQIVEPSGKRIDWRIVVLPVGETYGEEDHTWARGNGWTRIGNSMLVFDAGRNHEAELWNIHFQFMVAMLTQVHRFLASGWW